MKRIDGCHQWRACPSRCHIPLVSAAELVIQIIDEILVSEGVTVGSKGLILTLLLGISDLFCMDIYF